LTLGENTLLSSIEGGQNARIENGKRARSLGAALRDGRREAIQWQLLRFPFRLSGQGFFPGGEGLWRNDAQLAAASPGLVSVGGIMFLGNDFGTCAGFENPLTWRHVKRRVDRAGLPTALTFFTNAVMGLRESGTALAKKDWDGEPKFKSFCGEFLGFQAETLKPQLVVVMGPGPRSTLDSLATATTIAPGRYPKIRIGRHTTTVFFSTHPYGDFNFDDARKSKDASELREAWDLAHS